MTYVPPRLPWGVRRLFRLPATSSRIMRDLDEEMQAHLVMRVEELRASGLSESEALAEALRRFGDTDEFRDYASRRAMAKGSLLRVSESFAGWMQDLRFARRQLMKTPVVTAIAVLTLALGIGANTAIFSVVHHLLLAPLPFPNGNRIVMPMQSDGRGGLSSAPFELVEAWRERSTLVEEIAGAYVGTFTVDPDGTVNMTPNAQVTPNFFRVLGIHPVVGRGFTSDDARKGAPPVAMISHAMWQRDYGGRSDAMGQTLSMDEITYTIIGVTPPGATIPLSPVAAPEVWVASTLRGAVGGRSPSAFATLRTGATAERATRELETIAKSLTGFRVPITGARAMRAQDFIGTREQRSIQVLFVAVAALLLIACANVANLLLGRAWGRRREFAVRTALGAGRGRLIRQVLTESLMLSFAGGAAGLGVAIVALRMILALRPPTLAFLDTARIELVALWWTFGVCVLTGILFGCAPLFSALARKAGDVLRSETRGASEGVASRRARSALIVVEIAMSIVLLAGSGLLLRSFVELQRVPLGFDPEGLIYVELLPGPANRNRVPAVRAEVIDRIRAVPGVTDVVVGTMPGQGLVPMGQSLETDAGTRIGAYGINYITPDYFSVTRIRLLEGRLPDPAIGSRDTMPGPFNGRSLDVVVSRAMAKRLWPEGGAIGSRIRPISDPRFRPEPPITVVGIVDDVQLPGMTSDVRTLQLYGLLPAAFPNIPFIVRTSGSGEAQRPAIERAIRENRTLLVRSTMAAESYVREAFAPSRFAVALLTTFAVIALVLSAVGLYGVIAYGVTQRTREIGVRVALGAEPRRVASMVIRGGLGLAATGVAIGALIAAAAVRLLEGMLYGVSPGDPITFASIAALVAAIALLASYFPARRAVRIDPSEALRAD